MRDKEYANSNKIKEDLADLYDDVRKAFEDKEEQISDIKEYWDIYNCKLSDAQSYSGRSKAYVPIVHDALEARQTRFINMIFPQSEKHVEVTSNTNDIPYSLMALADHYVRSSGLRSQVPSLLRSGDIEGHLTVMVEWEKKKIFSTKRVKKDVTVEIEGEEEVSSPMDPVDDIDSNEESVEGPVQTIISSADIAVLPPTVDRLQDADVVAIAVRWTKAELKKRMKDGVVDKKAAKVILNSFNGLDEKTDSISKNQVNNAGVKFEGASKYVLVWIVWTRRIELETPGEWSVTLFAGEDNVLSCKRNPYWCGKIPIISVPLCKVPGSFWGVSKCKTVAEAQYAVNDVLNMGLDSAQYSLLPIVMTDPEKNPRIGTMILSMAAIWQTNPNDTKFAEFPPLWKEAFQIINQLKDQIAQSLTVNPSLLVQGNQGKKPSQAQVAQEQAVAIESVSDVVTIIEQGILSPLVEWYIALDHQYREDNIWIRKYGELGVKSAMQEITPIQMDARYEFRWAGSEGFKSAQQVQQMIAGLNILKSIPPQLLGGRRVDLGVVIENIVESIFGSRLAPYVLIDDRHEMIISAEMENLMLSEKIPVNVHQGDNDAQHIQMHLQGAMQAKQQGGDIQTLQCFMMHIQEHQKMMQAKSQAAMAGAGQQQGGGGGPRPGAQPGPPRGGQMPPGAVHQDRMIDSGKMPR